MQDSDAEIFGSDDEVSDGDFEQTNVYLQHAATPPHASPDELDDIPPPDDVPQPVTQESNQPPSSRQQEPRRKVPKSLAKYWKDNVPAALKLCRIPMNDVFNPMCMLPTEEQIGCMCARSKCMELLPQDHQRLLSYPNRGLPMCFVARAAEGLPIHIQKLLFFFSSVSNSMLDLAHFVVPTTATDLLYDKTEFRVVRGLVSTGVGLTPDPIVHSGSTQHDEFISIDEILEKRAQETPEQIKEPVQPLNMHVGFTGVVFNDEHGKETREVFAILMVTPSDNIDLMTYITDKFLLKPKMGAPKYEQLMDIYLEANSFFKEIMRYECFCNLSVDESRSGLPEDFRLEPGGKLGSATVLSPFQIPIKIFNTIRRDHPRADLTSIKITGCPELTFQRADEYTMEWCNYMRKSINEEARRQKLLLAEIQRYSTCKVKEEFPETNVEMSGGWPLETDDTNTVIAFGYPPLPLMHRFDANGARGNFSLFIASIGDADEAVPDLTRAIITAFLVHSSDLDSRPEIDHLLKDRRKANPLLVLRTYYGPEADPFSALVLANRQRMSAEALRSDIQVRRARGSPVLEVIRVIKDYLASIVKNLESMIECQVFRSATVTQMKAIVDLMDFDEVCTKSKDSIAASIAERSKRIAKPRKYDSMYRAWNCFMKTWEEMNKFFSLNAGNLVCAIEVMLSQLMFKFAHTNDTWTFFFVTVVVMAGNGHFQCQTPDGPVPVRIKPNTTGMDYLLARVMDLWNAMYEKLMIPPKDRHNLILNCMRFTATVWENLVTAQAAAGRLTAVPPADANFQAMSLTEIRDSLKSLIQYGPPRGEETGQTCSFNSQEIESTRTRVASRKRKLGNNNIVVISSNVGSKNNEQKEEGNTLDAVCAVFPPGVPPPAAKRVRMEFNDMDANVNTARHQPLGNKDEAVNCIAYTSNFAGLIVGLLNHIGAFPTEVNPVVAAFHDWGCYYIKQFISSSMDIFVRDNFSRMKEGYKSRGIVMSIWLKTILTLSLGKTKQEAIQHLWLDIHTDALPLINVPLVFCNLLYRGVHMASLIMTSVIADHLGIPVVSFKNLDKFFKLDAPPDLTTMDPDFKEDYRMIREFVLICFQNNRFCPMEDGPLCTIRNICCYISGDATQELVPTNPKNSLLRILPGKDKDESHDISYKVALRIAAQYGETLFGQCHMGPEISVYRLALVYLTERFAPDFRGLISPKMFYSQDHLKALGLEQSAYGMTNYSESSHPPFARQFNLRTRDQLQAQAIGVNIWSLLAVVSLVGSTDIHPDVSNCFANGLIEAILGHSPEACTPGNICPTSRFDHGTNATRLFVSAESRPKHFLRPNEPSFVMNGILPIAKAIGRFAPEDMLHAPQLSAISKNLHCSIMEIPACAFTSSYPLMPDVYYTFHVPHGETDLFGTLRVELENEHVSVITYSTDFADLRDVENYDFMDWEEKIRTRGLVITPLITRGGAAVVIEQEDPVTKEKSKTIGCLIPYKQDTEDLLDPKTCKYHALINSANDVAELFFRDVLTDGLLGIGEILYLDMQVISDDRFRSQCAPGKVLYTRLSVPHIKKPEIGKLYVMCLYQARGAINKSSRSTSAITLAVNPWDVQLVSEFKGRPSSIVKLLH